LRAAPSRAAEPAFAVYQATNDVIVVDLQTATVASRWSTNSNPRAIAIAGDGRAPGSRRWHTMRARNRHP